MQLLSYLDAASFLLSAFPSSLNCQLTGIKYSFILHFFQLNCIKFVIFSEKCFLLLKTCLNLVECKVKRKSLGGKVPLGGEYVEDIEVYLGVRRHFYDN